MSAALIEAHSIVKTFAGEGGAVRALDDVSLSVGAGEFVSVVGPSGCGKTTLMHVLVGLAEADGGAIAIGGRNVRGPFTDVGIVFQNAELLEWRTALQNVMLQIEIRRLARREYEARARTLLANVGLGDFVDAYPAQLSGGMKQRVALCRALVHDPEIILMDEPFGALDALTRDQLNLDLQQMRQARGTTAILITHSIDEAVFLSDRVIVMTPRPGRIADEIIVDLPRPRPLDIKETPAFAALCGRIRRCFEALGVFRT